METSIFNSWTQNAPSLTIGFAGVERQSDFEVLSKSNSLMSLDSAKLADFIIYLNPLAKLNGEGSMHRPKTLDNEAYLFCTWHDRLWLVKTNELLSPKRGGSHLRYTMYDITNSKDSIVNQLNGSIPNDVEQLMSKLELYQLKDIVLNYKNTSTYVCYLSKHAYIWKEEMQLLIEYISSHMHKDRWYALKTTVRTDAQKDRRNIIDGIVNFHNEKTNFIPSAFTKLAYSINNSQKFRKLHENQKIHLAYFLIRSFVLATNDKMNFEFDRNIVSNFFICWVNENEYDIIDSSVLHIMLLLLFKEIEESALVY